MKKIERDIYRDAFPQSFADTLPDFTGAKMVRATPKKELDIDNMEAKDINSVIDSLYKLGVISWQIGDLKEAKNHFNQT